MVADSGFPFQYKLHISEPFKIITGAHGAASDILNIKQALKLKMKKARGRHGTNCFRSFPDRMVVAQASCKIGRLYLPTVYTTIVAPLQSSENTAKIATTAIV